jgi:hypothetical protein
MFPSMGKIKEKEWPFPPSHPKSHLNLFIHVFISRIIFLTLSVQSSLKAPIKLRMKMNDQKRTIMKGGQLPLIVNTIFNDH